MTLLSPIQSYLEVDDKELLNLYVHGELDALAELFKRHNSK
jgi:hypothetical protein